MAEMIVDASGHVLGRLATRIAKEVLKGNEVHVVNAEQAVISGNPEFVLKDYKEKINRGDPYHGPFYPRIPDKILKRVVRGMLPYKKPRGSEAFKRLKVFSSVPEELKGKGFKRFKDAENRLECKFITLGKLSEKLGAKKI
jgi:large subunit ribosomal protein L13